MRASTPQSMYWMVKVDLNNANTIILMHTEEVLQYVVAESSFDFKCLQFRPSSRLWDFTNIPYASSNTAVGDENVVDYLYRQHPHSGAVEGEGTKTSRNSSVYSRMPGVYNKQKKSVLTPAQVS